DYEVNELNEARSAGGTPSRARAGTEAGVLTILSGGREPVGSPSPPDAPGSLPGKPTHLSAACRQPRRPAPAIRGKIPESSRTRPRRRQPEEQSSLDGSVHLFTLSGDHFSKNPLWVRLFCI